MGIREKGSYGALRAGCMVVLALALTPVLSAWSGGGVRAGEVPSADVYADMLRRYDAMNAELEHAIREIENGVDASPVPKRVLSVHRNASVTVGGEIRADYSFAKGKGEDMMFDPGLAGGGKFTAAMGDFAISTARVSVDARAGDRWRGYIDFNLHDSNSFHALRQTVNPNNASTPNPTRDYERRNATPYAFINQAYIELMKGDHTGFGGIVGLVKLPFGLWRRPNLFAKSFLDAPDLTGSYLAGVQGWENGVRLPHASRFVDPAVAAMIYYEMRDIVRFDAAVFQERNEEENVLAREGGRKIRSDELAPRSWQLGASIQPLDGWELTAHFRNRYSAGRGLGYWANSPSRWDFRNNMASAGSDPEWNVVRKQWVENGGGESFGSVKNEQALVIGVAAEIPGTKLSASVEYAHGWNQGFNKYINSDSVNVGLSYKLTPRMTVHAQGEWLHVKDRSWMAETASGWQRDTRNHHLYRAMLGAEYELSRYLTLEAGWQYEYWRTRASVSGEERLTTANMFYAGTRFVF